MPDPVNTIVDRIPLPANGVMSFDHFNDTIYCTGDAIRRIKLSTKEIAEIGPPARFSGAIAVVDFHRPFPVPPDVLGSGTPDGRIYIATIGKDFLSGGMVPWDDFEAVEIVPSLGDRQTQFKLSPQVASTFWPPVWSMVGSNDGRRLYYSDSTTLMLGVVDLEGGPRTVGGYQLDSFSFSMVISPDDRFIYAAHPNTDSISVVDTAAMFPAVRKVAVGNGPWGLALSGDGKRLFVAQSGLSGTGDQGTGTLTVLDTQTMAGMSVITGDQSIDVAVNSSGTRAYVSNTADGTVSVVDVTGTPAVIATITGLVSPSYVRMNDDDNRLYVLENSPNVGIAVVAV